MSKKRRGRSRQEQLTKRYLEATVRRARDEIIHAVLFATQPADREDETFVPPMRRVG